MMNSIILVSLFLSFSLMAATEPQPDSLVPVVMKDNAFTFYRSFPRLTRQPHNVAPLTAVLCTTPSPALIEQERKMTGPHYQARVHLYANPVAQKAITDKTESFPVQAVIVKEKLDEQNGVTAVGGMIKRAKGYDPANGDWEYFYATKTGEFASGRMQNCIACHRAKQQTDYVYSVWSLGK